jgi:hypothetical protein
VSGIFNVIGPDILIPDMTGFVSGSFEVVVIGQFGAIVICDFCIWCTSA